MLLSAFVLAVFYPTQFSELSLVDDLGAIGTIFSEEHFSLINIFFPRATGAGYYRPLIGLSYWLDKQFWFLDEHLMHFESVVAHLVNGILVYFISKEAVSLYLRKRGTYIPLASALLFSLHPIVTESVNWISGRTDIMMSMFVLFSVLCILRYKRQGQVGSRILFYTAIISAVIAVLAKETALGYLVGLPLLVWCRTSETQYEIDPHSPLDAFRVFLAYYAAGCLAALYLNSFWFVLLITGCYLVYLMYVYRVCTGCNERLVKIDKVIIYLISFVGISGCFVLLRKIVFVSSVGKIGQTVMLMTADLNYTISLFCGAIGFYVKKFFLPLPLNFFILEIDPLYDLLGIAVFLLIMRLIVNRTLPAVIALIGFFLVLPALPFAFGTIAWTAYAERYIYLSNAFWVISIVLAGDRWLGQHERRRIIASWVTVIICLAASLVSYQRNCIWKTNVSLLKNTVEQSPKIRKLRDIYINALIDAGQSAEAEKQYEYSITVLPAAYYDDRADLMMGGELVKEGRFAEALHLYQEALQRTRYSSEKLLAAAYHLVKKMLKVESLSSGERDRLAVLEREYATSLYAKTQNPYLLVEGGQLALQQGLFAEAFNSFDAALRYWPSHDYRRIHVERLRDIARKSH